VTGWPILDPLLQGQQAPIVLFSMATSSGEDVPRNLAFLFSRHRLNVAISRAQCLAILVCSPRLLEARCHSIEEMELVNALCRLVEYAEGDASRPTTYDGFADCFRETPSDALATVNDVSRMEGES
jgi:AAA domain